MSKTQVRPRNWTHLFVGAVLQFALAVALLLLGHTGPGVLLLAAGVTLVFSALWTRVRSNRPPIDRTERS